MPREEVVPKGFWGKVGGQTSLLSSLRKEGHFFIEKKIEIGY